MTLVSSSRLAGFALAGLLGAALSTAAGAAQGPSLQGSRPLITQANPQAQGGIQTPQDTRVTNLIGNGSFEKPVLANGGYATFAVGANLGSWTVVGPTGSSVLLINDQFTEFGYGFPAAQGKQSLDLTGAGANLPGGVQQSVATNPGTNYTLSFESGNIASGPDGTTSTVLVLVNGVQLDMATNFSGQGLMYEVWEPFTATFTATTSTTSIAFYNQDGPGDGLNGLDNIKMSVQR